ncbi:putative LRR receptor-like serine/threonine-protein kinase [Sesamum angolense]|uniref:LRR receptor-like serine/threonine-protein kinase n=1 Tax=Sesamum angolense TaxID=2727404 RepID=A0AAE2BPA5_9LAMI|nr:putative LRR receptor-like serine/threonine-protein kinase [Sesamum angolense]
MLRSHFEGGEGELLLHFQESFVVKVLGQSYAYQCDRGRSSSITSCFGKDYRPEKRKWIVRLVGWSPTKTLVNSPPVMKMQSSSSKQQPALFFLLGGIVLLLILLILVLVSRKLIKLRKLKMLVARTTKQPVTRDVLSGNLRTISYFDFQMLKKATKNFDQNNLLGRGKATRWKVGRRKEAISRQITARRNRIPSRGESPVFLNWTTRFQIILGIARGLQYLHEDSHVRIVHRDIKASNILLDDKFQPRIGDFGLARFFPEDQAYLSTRFAGTLGYTAPEYAIRGELSEKADIYSFGVLVLEIISSRKNTDLTLPSEMQYLPEYSWRLYERGMLTDLIDPRMRGDDVVEKDVLQVIKVVFLCLQPHANLRPPMSEIVAMLTCKVEVNGTPVRPTFLDRKPRNVDKISWDSISEPFPSPLKSDSSSFPQHPK